MKIIASTLIALSVLAGVAPASSFDTKTFWEQQRREAGAHRTERNPVSSSVGVLL
jgi:hypothetical protein